LNTAIDFANLLILSLASEIMASHPNLFSDTGRFSLTELDKCLILFSDMELQPSTYYYAMFADLVKRHNELTQRRNELEIEVAKLKQLIIATFPLIPEEKQRLFQTEINEMEEQNTGLLNAIKLVFSAHKDEWLTPAQVRDFLILIGFDLTQYKANPLASIVTTLRRMVSNHLKSKTLTDGQVLYQRSVTMLERMTSEGDTPLDTARKRFAHAHKAKLTREAQKKALREAAEEMGEGDSEVGTPPSIENEFEAPRRKIRL
jgi:hypothetical protein